MDCCLILYHPYRSLTQYIYDLCPPESSDSQQLLQTAWCLVNDSYRTDICLLYPPSMVALACLQMACVLLKKDYCKQWFIDLNIDFDKIIEITRHLTSLYDLLKTYEDKEIKDILAKVPKPRLSNQQLPQQQQPQQSGVSTGGAN